MWLELSEWAAGTDYAFATRKHFHNSQHHIAGGPRAGSKGGGGLSALLGADQLSGLLPRLYRTQYDPSTK